MPKAGSASSLSRQARAEIARSSGIHTQYRPGPWKDMDSSRMQRARYDSTRREIHVVFRDDTPWIYYDIPQNIWDNMRRSASPGKYINRVLNAFPYSQAPTDFESMDAAAMNDENIEEPPDEMAGFREIYGTGTDLFDDRLR